MIPKPCWPALLVLLGASPLSPAIAATKTQPHIIVLGVNGMEWDIVRPLLARGEMPNLAQVIERGAYGKLQTLAAPNCPKVYSAIATSAPPRKTGSRASRSGGLPLIPLC